MAGEVTYLPSHDDGGKVDVPIVANAPNAIDQVRELLYGEALRSHGRRVDDTHESLAALEQRMLQRFSEIESSIESLARLLRHEQGAAVRAIGGTITEMGRQIASLGEIHDRGSEYKSAR